MTAAPAGPPVTVIGYGSELRGDDGVGPRVARAVAGWGLPGVVALVVHQLTPELAPALAATGRAYFVDAWHPAGAGGPRLLALGPAPGALAGAHSGDPGALLALAEALYGRRPPAWQLLIPASDFAYGEALSPGARRGVAAALRMLRAALAPPA